MAISVHLSDSTVITALQTPPLLTHSPTGRSKLNFIAGKTTCRNYITQKPFLKVGEEKTSLILD